MVHIKYIQKTYVKSLTTETTNKAINLQVSESTKAQPIC